MSADAPTAAATAVTGSANGNTPAGSLMDELRRQQAQAVAGQTVDLTVPGYRNPALVARYRFLDSTEAKQIGKRVQENYTDDFDRLLYGTIQQLIAACVGLYARADGRLVPVDPDGGGPAGYDERCAQFFGFPVDAEHPAQSTVRAVFKGNDYAIVDHGGRLQAWMSDTTMRADESLGES